MSRFRVRPKQWRATAERLFETLSLPCLIALAITLHIPWNPGQRGLEPDSGVFAYGGSLILEGVIPYQGFWDNKAPGVFFIDALAIALFGRSPWAIWFLDLVWVALLLIVCWKLLRRHIQSPIPPFVGSLVFLLILMHPDLVALNSTELYAALPQFLLLYVGARYIERPAGGLSFVAGLLTGFTFLVRQASIGLGIAFLLLTLFAANGEKLSSRLRQLGLFLLGSAIPLLATALLWLRWGAFRDLVDALVFYNFAYAGGGPDLRSIYGALRRVFLLPPLGPVAVIATALFFEVAVYHLKRLLRARSAGDSGALQGDRFASSGLLVFALAGFPLDFFSTLITGRNFWHYYLTLVPTLTVGLAFSVEKYVLSQRLRPGRDLFASALIGLLLFGLGIDAAAKELPSRSDFQTFQQTVRTGRYVITPIEETILQRTERQDVVLLWGSHASPYFLTGRRPPSKYLIPIPLFIDADRFEEFLADLERRPPTLVFAQEHSSAQIPYPLASGSDLCPNCEPEVRAQMEAFKKFLETNYTKAGMAADWVVLERIKPGDASP